MKVSWLKVLADSINSFSKLASCDHINSDPVEKFYKKAEEILKLLKPVLDAIVSCEITSCEVLSKEFEELTKYVNELRELFESWQPLSSKIYHVLQIELLMVKAQGSCIDILQQLKSSKEDLPDELSASTLEHYSQKIKHMGHEQISSVIEEALRDQKDSIGPSPHALVKIAENLGLRSNQELLVEDVALEQLKENAEQAGNNSEAEFAGQLISIINRMQDRLIKIKQSQTCNPVPVPSDLCCPLSLQLMIDPVIVASGQTYERAFIKKWIDLGLTVCPKTRQSLVRTNLIPNYTVKALIANWCELNNVQPPDPGKLVSFDSDAPLHPHIARSRSDPPILPDSIQLDQSTGSLRNLISVSGFQKERALPSHLRSTSEGSLYGILQNGHGLDIATTSLNDSEENCDSEGKKRQMLAKQSTSPARKESSNSVESEEQSQDHNGPASSSGAHPNADENLDTEVSTSSATTKKEPSESSTPLVLFKPSSWRRPSERLIPRVVPSVTSETGSGHSEIEAQVRRLVEDLRSSSADTQREATAELRLLARNSMGNRIAIASCGAVSLLIDLLHSTDSETQENAVTTLLNLSINDNNKILIANADAIEPLIHVLESGSPEAKENAAATLFSLSVIEEIKIRIGRSGAIEPLVNLLGSGTPRGKKDAATALFNLSIHHENKGRIIEAGAVRHLMELMDPAAGLVDKAVAVLANLATLPEGRAAIGQEGGIQFLVEVIELGSPRGKENAAAALCLLCTGSNRFCNMVLQEGAIPPLVALSQSGTPRAREKAQSLLNCFRNHRHGNAGRG